MQPAYSRTKVTSAGKTYIDLTASPEDRARALAVINNWRSSHSYPLNTLQVNLRRVARMHDADPTVAQRIKRLPSIRSKLERIPGMELARMHDLGGCRAVLSSTDAVDEVVNYYTESSQIKHRLIRHDPYVDEPKTSGYRGVHLVYAYYSDKKPTYNDLRIELQIRSQLQHAWATAVETVGTFTQQALKSSSGEADWLRFFALMSSALAIREGRPLVPGTPGTEKELIPELRRYAADLDVVARLSAYGAAVQHASERMREMKGHTFLLQLDTQDRTLLIHSYEDRAIAADEYSTVEREIEGESSKDVVLVTVESLASLRAAYPNYFLDTSAFLDSVREAIGADDTDHFDQKTRSRGEGQAGPSA